MEGGKCVFTKHHYAKEALKSCKNVVALRGYSATHTDLATVLGVGMHNLVGLVVGQKYKDFGPPFYVPLSFLPSRETVHPWCLKFLNEFGYLRKEYMHFFLYLCTMSLHKHVTS